MITKKLLAASVVAAGLLVGCGGGSSDAPASTSTAATGYFVDAAVANADYDCVADGTVNKTTGADGSFSCNNMVQVRFHIGNLVLGEVATVPADGYVFPQDLLGVPRATGVDDARVAAMAQLLQSLDVDGNPSNGIVIAQHEKDALVEVHTSFNPAEVHVYLESASVNPEHIPTMEHAKEHLRTTVQTITGAAPAAPQAPSAPQAPHTPDAPHAPDAPHVPEVHI